MTAPGAGTDAPTKDFPESAIGLLSVAEVQHALRQLRARRTTVPPGGRVAPSRAGDELAARLSRKATGVGETDPWSPRDDGASAASVGDLHGGWPEPDEGALGSDWVTVVAAHAGAGASTVALAIGDAVAAGDRPVHLVETAQPARSGMVGAALAELGIEATGVWRRGSRSRITIDRRATGAAPGGWPPLPTGDYHGITVVDLGLPAPADLARLAAARNRTVVVCRATVPGVRLIEQVLSELRGSPVVVAVVGPRRWPGVVNASVGPKLRVQRTVGRVVTVPTDRRLEVSGLTAAALPKPLLAAGRRLWQLLEDETANSVQDGMSSSATAPGPRR